MESCWLIEKSLDAYGYPYFKLMGKNIKLHRMIFRMTKGRLLDNMVIDHICNHRNCINPDHLQQITQGENVRRGSSISTFYASRSACIRDHEYTPENTHWRGTTRVCRTCKRESERRRHARNKALSAAEE